MRASATHIQALTSAAMHLAIAVDPSRPHVYPREMSMRDLITQKLTEAFAPAALEVVDESHLHEGHAGHRPGGESHFRVYIVADAFKGKSRIERHRMVNETLIGELEGSVHALAIRALAPGEDRG
jgi:BolA protein